MIKSMTGYGFARGNAAGFDVTVELKSVNNRYLETAVRLPRNFMFAEDTIKCLVSKHISRGKVDVFITVNSSEANDVTVKINKPLSKGYYDAIKLMGAEFGISDDISAVSLAKFPDVLSVERNDIDSEAVCAGIAEITETALKDYDSMREREGEKLKLDISSHLAIIEDYVEKIEAEAPETAKRYEEKLLSKLRDVLKDNVDENRIVQEAAIFADHIAVDEETVRLKSHIAQMKSMLNIGSPIGKKMDFLIQEFNREANTIGSKCQNSTISYIVVDTKSEIEKIREQIQNVE